MASSDMLLTVQLVRIYYIFKISAIQVKQKSYFVSYNITSGNGIWKSELNKNKTQQVKFTDTGSLNSVSARRRSMPNWYHDILKYRYRYWRWYYNYQKIPNTDHMLKIPNCRYFRPQFAHLIFTIITFVTLMLWSLAVQQVIYKVRRTHFTQA